MRFLSRLFLFVSLFVMSYQLTGGMSASVADETQPHLVMLIAEDEYRTNESLPVFAAEHLDRDFRVTTVSGSKTERNDIPGIEAIADADVLLVSVHRRVLPTAQLKFVRDYVAAGKPVVGIRTASHAFSLRKKQPPAGLVDWPEFDAQVFGGNYHNHHGNKLKSTVAITNAKHKITEGLTPQVIPQGWSLYQTFPLATGAEILTTGTIEGLPPEPVSWTYIRSDGGRSFYSSMGHVDDFKNQRFNQLLHQAICWAAEIEPTASEVSSSEPLWKARFVTPENAFTPGIEGPACDAAGNILAVNFEKQGTIGRVKPDGSAEVYVTLPEGSTGNGIRFDAAGDFFVADYSGHNVLKVDSKTRNVTTLAHNDKMNQPNDLAIAPDGTLYASDPAWNDSTGQLWRIDMDGTTTRLAKDMGTTNGIDVSPDGTTLYVNESVQRNIWAFDITSEKLLTNKRLIKKFPDHGFDGMRCDVDGNLYITRYGDGTVVKMSPAGEILQTVAVLGARPSNVCFGGPDGCTVYVTQVDDARLVSFRVDRPGRVWAERQSAN
jgi:sugar lactone lactonase YvrE/type 1 glutamine amidotransferase